MIDRVKTSMNICVPHHSAAMYIVLVYNQIKMAQNDILIYVPEWNYQKLISAYSVLVKTKNSGRTCLAVDLNLCQHMDLMMTRSCIEQVLLKHHI